MLSSRTALRLHAFCENLAVAALSADSAVSTLRVLVDGEVVVSEWEGTPGATELQEIPGVEGSEGAAFTIQGIMEPGEYLAISEVSQSVSQGWSSTCATAVHL